MLYLNSTRAHLSQNFLYLYAFVYISLMMILQRSKQVEGTSMTIIIECAICWIKYCTITHCM